CSLAGVGTVELQPVGNGDAEGGRSWIHMMARYHYLGSGPIIGRQLRYLIVSSRGVLGGLSFSAPAWRLASRDGWIGWDDRIRQANLHLVVCNSRFLILPGVHVPNLASCVLGMAERRVVDDWEEAHGVRPVLMETFVEGTRFRGTSYLAANWQSVGMSSGRGRNGTQGADPLSRKMVLLRPLARGWKMMLNREPAAAAVIRPGTVSAPFPAECGEWVEEELGNADYGDPRLTNRLLSVAREMYAHPHAPLTEVFGGNPSSLKAAYRFFDNPHTTMEATLQPHYESTLRRAMTEKVVLAVQDTTSLNYTTHTSVTGVGPIGARAGAHPPVGLHVHDTMAFTPQGVPLGLMHVRCWARDEEVTSPRGYARQLDPIEEKESIKWLESYRQVRAFRAHLPKEVRVVSVGDREADIYELLHEAAASLSSETPVDLLVRASKDRKLTDPEDHKLWEALEAQAEIGRRTIHIPRRGSTAPRSVELTLRVKRVCIKAPSWKEGLPSEIGVWAVLAREEGPSTGKEALEWMLLTTVPLSSAEDAARVLDWYAVRWQIEVFHRTLKTGFQIENRLFGTADRIESCLAVDMIMGWRVMHLVKLGRENPNAPCSVYFEEAQWRALLMRTNRDPAPWTGPEPTLGDAMRMVAKLGGYLGRKSDGPPGAEVLWRGLQHLDDITEAWVIMSGFQRPPVLGGVQYG
ncbi:MAG: IS4 family transposase, partial [Planctomycetes bacterium]|nr:IS4 family transposase [Planctomycetota bacterium]